MRSELKIEPFNIGRDYPGICEWWRHYGWRFVPLDALSESGWVVRDGDVTVAAVWLYFSNSSWFWFEFLVANPEVSNRRRFEAIELLIREAAAIAQARSLRIITATKQPGLIRLFEKHGFLINDTGMVTLSFAGAK